MRIHLCYEYMCIPYLYEYLITFKLLIQQVLRLINGIITDAYFFLARFFSGLPRAAG